MTNELFERQREKREQALTDAALDLCGFMGVSALKVKVPGTDPAVYVVVGEEEKIRGLLDIRS